MFLERTAENGDYNQYWYSGSTISNIVKELEAQCSAVAFLSSPSVYFGLAEDSALRQSSKVLDLDDQWQDNACFVRYDFHKPEDIPAALHGAFDGVVIDPPFVTADVWRKYAEAVALLLKPGGKIICTTLAENAALLATLFGVTAAAFKPSVPNLIYQYDLYTNFSPTVLALPNPEVPA